MKIGLIVTAIIVVIFAIALSLKIKARIFMTGAKGKKFTATLTIKFCGKRLK